MTNMNWLIYHIASGHSFFTGVALIVVAVLISAMVGSFGNKPVDQG